MDKLSRSSLYGNSQSSSEHHSSGDDDMPWLEPTGDYDYPEDDNFKIDDYPLKRRQRRQRLHSLHCYVARTTVVAVATSASMLTRQVEHMARADGISQLREDANGTHGIFSFFLAIIDNFKSCLGQSIGGTSARIGQAATSLANAIGEPPQRALGGHEDQDAPLLMFWAINLCAICTVATVVFFILAFTVSPETSSEPEAVDQIQLSTPNNAQPTVVEGKKLGGLFRVLGVVGLSLVSGCGLGLRHPVQSALLSGF